jgi:hypothetical protein
MEQQSIHGDGVNRRTILKLRTRQSRDPRLKAPRQPAKQSIKRCSRSLLCLNPLSCLYEEIAVCGMTVPYLTNCATEIYVYAVVEEVPLRDGSDEKCNIPLLLVANRFVLICGLK